MSQIAEKLKSIQNFGGIDANSDSILLTAFEDHDAYKNAINFQRPIVIGRKGSGKSAVFKKITSDTAFDVQPAGFTFSDYPWDHHTKQKQSNVPQEECYTESWKYFISLMLCKLIIKSYPAISSDTSAQAAASDLESFVKDSYGSPDPGLANIFTPGRKLKFSGKLSALGVGGEAQSIDVKELPTFYSEINRNILDAIVRCMPRQSKFYVCFDELDIGFDPTNKDYLHRLIGLIRAAKYTNDRMRLEGLNAAAVILLRDDIWHTLRFEDKNKLKQDQVSEIWWSKNPGPNSLRALMERRFKEVVGNGATSVSWSEVFNENRQMPRFQNKYDYICDRGFLRPRDIIQYCNEALHAFQDKPGVNVIDNEHLRSAEDSYSRYFMQELEDELHKHSQAYEQYFEVLKGLSNVKFSKEDFESAWNYRRSMFGPHDTPEKALSALFDFSVIGFLATGGRGAGSTYVWHYLEPRAKFNPVARTYQVHLGLKNEFDLKLYARK